MTHKLAELLGIDEQTESDSPVPEPAVVTTEALATIDKIEAALSQVTGLEASDTELDELALLAKNSYTELFDLGMQTESRFSAEIFGVASNLLSHAINAKTAKINAKLKRIDLQLKKAALDQKAQKTTEEVDNTPIGEGKALDRNELLKLFSTTNDK